MTPYDVGLLIFGVIALAGILILILDTGSKRKERP
jgi:hypothetical protein